VKDWYFIAERPAPAPHLAHPEGCAALRIVLATVPRASRSCAHFPDGFDLRILRVVGDFGHVLMGFCGRSNGSLTVTKTCAWATDGEEQLGPGGYAGGNVIGCFILGAVYQLVRGG